MVSYGDLCYIISLIHGGPGALGQTTTHIKNSCFSLRKENRVQIEQVNENSEWEVVLFKIALYFSFTSINEIA